MNSGQRHPFWGSLSPLGGLAGGGLLIMASARLSWAVTVAGSLLWVYGLSAFVYAILSSSICKKFFPAGGRQAIYTCLASFFGAVYLLLCWLLCPFAAFEVFFLLLLVPLFCAGSGTFKRIMSSSKTPRSDVEDYAMEAVSEAVVLAILLVAVSIVREPLSYCSLSFPGTPRGMVTIMYFRAGSLFPIGLFVSSAGALLLLGYLIALYQYSKNSFFPKEADK
ncbi:MAG: hypothetical protein LBG91_03270 [Treponema sp.]|jgi:hypothetical protein|nr:hypothetical protein [Treponema sp.]